MFNTLNVIHLKYDKKRIYIHGIQISIMALQIKFHRSN